MANAISIAHNHDLTSMIDMYAQDEDFAQIAKDFKNYVSHEPYMMKDGFLMYGHCLCITKNLCEKVMYESHVLPYTGHCGIHTTTQAIETYFYWPSMRKDI